MTNKERNSMTLSMLKAYGQMDQEAQTHTLAEIQRIKHAMAQEPSNDEEDIAIYMLYGIVHGVWDKDMYLWLHAWAHDPEMKYRASNGELYEGHDAANAAYDDYVRLLNDEDKEYGEKIRLMGHHKIHPMRIMTALRSYFEYGEICPIYWLAGYEDHQCMDSQIPRLYAIAVENDAKPMTILSPSMNPETISGVLHALASGRDMQKAAKNAANCKGPGYEDRHAVECMATLYKLWPNLDWYQLIGEEAPTPVICHIAQAIPMDASEAMAREIAGKYLRDWTGFTQTLYWIYRKTYPVLCEETLSGNMQVMLDQYKEDLKKHAIKSEDAGKELALALLIQPMINHI